MIRLFSTLACGCVVEHEPNRDLGIIVAACKEHPRRAGGVADLGLARVEVQEWPEKFREDA